MGNLRSLAVLMLLAAAGLAAYNSFVDGVHDEELVEIGGLALAAYLIALSGPIAKELGVPHSLVELVAGIIAASIGVKSGEALKILASIGANVALFMAGAEVDVRLIRYNLRKVVLLGLITLATPLSLASIISKVKGLSLEAMLALSAGLVATSAAVTYSILAANGYLASRYGQIVLASAMVADIAGMLLLNAATAAIDPMLILYVMIIGAAVLLQPIIPRLSGAPFEAEVRIMLMTVIVLGVLSEFIGVHSVLTSFILGMVVSETVRSRKVLKEKLEGLATGFFTPFFFIVSGMTVDVAAIYSNLGEIIMVGLAITLVRFLAPFTVFKSLLGLSTRKSLVLSASLTPLLTVTVIASSVGLSLGLFTSDVYSWLIGSIVATTVFSSVTSSVFARRPLTGLSV